MSDLLHIFLRIAMHENNETKYHSQLDLSTVDNQTLFALQLLHRWCIRSVIFSKYPQKPPTKPVSISMYIFIFARFLDFKLDKSGVL